ncbi:MAG: response regulator [Candidatus Limnocylindrales bacterium]|jgi:pilus assembly protein CpaE
MTDRIQVLIVDDIPETRDHLTRLLGFESDIQVIGTASSGANAIEKATTLLPDVILMDINMPDMDGIAATERLSAQVPTAAVVMMSVQGEADYLRRSMLAGAREFLVKPFSSDELTASIRQVYAREKEKGRRAVIAEAARTQDTTRDGQVVAVFSPKGGVGRTTIAVNLAVAASELGKKVTLIDASLQFGDVAVLVNLNPSDKSIANLLPELEQGLDPEAVEAATLIHSSGTRVLLSPPSPEMAELITPAGVKNVVEILRQRSELVVVDCAAWFNDTLLGILDRADVLLTVLTLEITSIKSTRLFLAVAEQLGYSHKVRLVLNRADTALGIRVADVEHSIGRKVDHAIVSDGRTVVYALNRGVPFVLSNRESQVSQDVLRLAKSIIGGPKVREENGRKAPQKSKSLFAWR